MTFRPLLLATLLTATGAGAVAEGAMPFRLYSGNQEPIQDGWAVRNMLAPTLGPRLEMRADNVLPADGGLVLRLCEPGPRAQYAGAEIVSEARDEATKVQPLTYAWRAKAPIMDEGVAWGLFVRNPETREEFDIELFGTNGSRMFKPAVQARDEAGNHVQDPEAQVFVALPFDASQTYATYSLTVSPEWAIWKVNGVIVATASRSEMPGGAWPDGRLESHVNIWTFDPSRFAAAYWNGHLSQDYLGHVLRASTPGVIYNPALLMGSARDDTLVGTADLERLVGGGGDDTLRGGSGTDRLEGGAGDDTLIGGEGADILVGGPGRDTFVLRRGDGDIVVDFEPGIDTRVWQDAGSVDWDL